VKTEKLISVVVQSVAR